MRKHLLVLVLAACGGSDDGVDGSTFIARGSSTSSITLRWQPVDGATGYQLERDGESPIALDASADTYLDRVAAGAHAYRLTAIGVDAPAQEASASTTEDAAVITGDDPLIGEPVIATIGRAGGMIELPDGTVRAIIPAGALPDGATVTLQQIASPAGNGELAIEVTSEPAFATDVDVSFAVDDLGNLAIAEKQDDGMWIAIDGRVDGDRAVVTMEAATSSARAIPLRLRRRLVRLRRVSIDPDVARVKKDAQVHFIARGVFSDDQCEATPSPLCFPRNDLGGWFLGAEPIVETRSLANSTGTWTLGGPGRIDAPRTAHIVRYTAPSSRPSVTEWPITFKHTSGPSASATIKFMDNRFELKFIYDGFEDGIGNNLLAAVHDELAVNVVIDELGHVTAIGQLHNATSMVSNLRPVEPGTSTAQTSPFELATITSAQFGNQVGFSAILSGETVYANTLVTFQSGESVAFPGGVAPTSITLFSSEPLPFDTLLSESTFVFPPTNWKMKVTPIE